MNDTQHNRRIEDILENCPKLNDCPDKDAVVALLSVCSRAVAELKTNICTVHPCSERNPQPGGEENSHYKKHNLKMQRLLSAVMGDEFKSIDELQDYIRENIL